MDAIGDDHPLFAGRPGAIAPRGANFTLQNSDLLLIIGARMDMALTAYAHDKLARAAKKIYVDIDPAEIRKMKTPIHIPIVADARAFIVETLRQLAAGEAAPRVRHDWIARCRDWKAKYPVVQPEHVQRQSPVSVYHFSRTLSELLTGDDIIAPGSSGFACEIFYLVFKVINGQRILHNRGTGAMGLGIPSAIGACLGGGRRRTICVDGDGGFQMNIQELATVAHLQLPIKFFVVNNDGYASIRTSQSKYFGRVIGADKTSGVALPDVCKVAAAYNVATSRISQAAGMIEHFRDILARPGPHVCEVIVPSDEPRGPRVDSMQKPDGTMVSKPLEDLWPFLDREEFLSNMIIPPLPE
jgi:acetolactate synthase-1/2/3 large subunit